MKSQYAQLAGTGHRRPFPDADAPVSRRGNAARLTTADNHWQTSAFGWMYCIHRSAKIALPLPLSDSRSSSYAHEMSVQKQSHAAEPEEYPRPSGLASALHSTSATSLEADV